MSYTKDLLADAAHFAGLFYGTEDLAIMLGLPIEEVRLAVESETDPLGLTIKKARLLSDSEFRTAVITLAKQGSSPAQALTMQLIQHIDG